MPNHPVSRNMARQIVEPERLSSIARKVMLYNNCNLETWVIRGKKRYVLAGSQAQIDEIRIDLSDGLTGLLKIQRPNSRPRQAGTPISGFVGTGGLT